MSRPSKEERERLLRIKICAHAAGKLHNKPEVCAMQIASDLKIKCADVYFALSHDERFERTRPLKWTLVSKQTKSNASSNG